MEVQAHNDRFAKGLETFTMEANEFAEFTNEEFKQMFFGYEFREITVASYTDYSKLLGYKEADSVDWREKNAVTPVKN